MYFVLDILYKLKNVIIAFFVAIVGIVLIWIGSTKEISWVESIGSVFLISGVYTVIDTYFLKKTLVDLVVEKVKLDSHIESTGVIEIGTNLSKIQYQDYFQEANSCIDIVHIYARTWTNNNFDFIRNTVLNKDCKLRVVLINPESKFISPLESHFGYKDGDLIKYINEVTKKWLDLYIEIKEKQKYFTDKTYRRKNRKSYASKKYGSLELYYYNGQPTNSLYRIDQKLIVVTTKTSSKKTINVPYTIYKDLENNNTLYGVYKREIEEIIKEATKVDLDRLIEEKNGNDNTQVS